jgi:hypothetical protein
MKRFLHLTALSIAFSAIAVTLPSFWAPMPAKSAPIVSSQNVNFKPPDVTAPGNRQGATHRGDACGPDLSITPLIPEIKIGLTLAESPTFFAYFSQTSAQIEFILQTEDGENVVYETAFKLEKPGIVGVTIPASAGDKKSLEVGKRYQWSFSVVCNPKDRSGDSFVKGWVQRIEAPPTLKSDLANPDPMARLTAYATNGIWYETVATLADLRRQAPDDAMLTAEWTQLLQSQRLNSIANQPLVQSF